ncbi:Maf family protein [Dorea sp. D27]|uniref:Maf family protein n=1 Tax=Dorea sp. D27 TaxID=658665 RepID=UPI000673216D|nr:Maf family protein [Dorea sp. D27]KMZ54719.1 septum formation protein Maf [Dorea sp. D27]
MKYVLASASPRRKELLTQAGFIFDVMPADIEEKISGGNPPDIVMNLARQKALHVFKALPGEACTVIGADTVVVYNGEILGKPSGAEEAYDMLSLLADRTHQVYTGVSLLTGSVNAPDIRTFYEKTDVTFYPVTRQELQSYIMTGDPFDKAGAYGIQGPFAIHVKCISGDYNNVVGLPIARLYHELSRSICHEH